MKGRVYWERMAMETIMENKLLARLMKVSAQAADPLPQADLLARRLCNGILVEAKTAVPDFALDTVIVSKNCSHMC
ncbi:hypothetical protein Tco_0457644 [Tanacetum coccineum]